MPDNSSNFPRLPDLGFLLENGNSEMANSDIYESVSGFNPDFRISDELGDNEYWTQWEGRFDSKGGITGMWLPSANRMLVTRRTLGHHDTQFNILEKKGELSEPMMPWAVSSNSRGWFMDLPSSAGGLFQAVSRSDEKIETWRTGASVTTDVLWPCVYTSYLLDVPADAQVSFSYVPERLMRLREQSDKHLDVTQWDEFDIGDAYRELSFELGSLPEKKLDRSRYD